MGSYTWENFTSEAFYDYLVNFFQEIFVNNNRGNVVFVSRKAYCLFLLLKKKKVINSDACTIYSDRYVMKSLDLKLFKGHTICLVDDTISTCQHMNQVYDIIRKRSHSTAHVKPYVFVADVGETKCDVQRQVRLNSGLNVITCMQWKSTDVLRFSAIVNLILHQEGIPYAMELPIVSNRPEGELVLSKAEYAKLKNVTNGWELHECNQAGYMQNDMKYGVLIMRNNSIAEFMSNFVFRFCVRLQIVEKGEEIRMVAMPFAILKSVKFDELYKLFVAIYGRTEYGKSVENYRKERGNEEDIFIAIYRAIVYNLSSYIGDALIEFLNQCVLENSKAVFVDYNQKYNFEKDFCQITEDIIDMTYLDYIDVLFENCDFTQIKSQGNFDLNQYAKKFQGLRCDDRTMLLYLSVLINEVRYYGVASDLVNYKQNDRIKFISIEDLQHVLRITYLFEDKDYLDDLLAVCICVMLGQSKISNEIYYDSCGIIYRGFKYGTNSEALLDLSAKIFYVAVNKYYDVSIEQELYHEYREESLYKKNFEQFINVLRFFIIDNQLAGEVITIDEFKLYQEFFIERDRYKIRRIIKNKLFLGEDDKQPYYLEKLKMLIEMSDIYDL